jgi:hypothetical protein
MKLIDIIPDYSQLTVDFLTFWFRIDLFFKFLLEVSVNCIYLVSSPEISAKVSMSSL